jgi:hypothetical protein
MATLLGETTEDVIASFMQQIIVEYQGFGDAYRRKEPRETVAIPIDVQLLDEHLRPIADPFQAVTRDISCGGVGFFHTKPVDLPYVLIELAAPATEDRMKLLAKVEHCTEFGGLSLIGCRFARICGGGPKEDS